MTPGDLIGTIGGIAALIAAPSALIIWLLGRKGANKALDLQGDGVKVDQWQVLQTTYVDLLARAKADTAAAQASAKEDKESRDAALAELALHKEARETLYEQLRDTLTKFASLRALFLRVLKRGGIIMTEEEQAEFDATTPAARLATPRRKNDNPN